MEDHQVDIDSLVIVPLEKQVIKGAFANSNEGKEFQHLITWFQTKSLHSQQERKCKVYVALQGDEVVGYISVSMALPKERFLGLLNRTSFEHQMLLIGKLYVHPKYRSQGIGGLLTQFVLDIALKTDEMLGCAGILVDANNNERTIAFYEKFGFKEVEKNSGLVRMFFKI